MRPANQNFVFLLAVSVFAGCGTTGTSAPRWFRSTDEPDAAHARDYDPQPGFKSQGSPSPPPPAPPAYGVSHAKIKSVGFLRRFGKQGTAGHGCDTADCGDSCCPGESCKSGGCVTGRGCKTDDCAECGAGECAESSGPRQKCRLFECLRGGKHFKLFGRGACHEDDCCVEVQDDCGDKPCGENAGCSTCVPKNDDCADWMNFGIENSEGRVDDREPSLAERLANPFFDDADEPDPVPELTHEEESEPEPEPEPDAAQSDVPDAPEPITAPPQAILPSPFTGISASQSSRGGYFPSESGQPRVIVEPPQWRPNVYGESTGRHHSVGVRRIVAGEDNVPKQVPHQILIAPRH